MNRSTLAILRWAAVMLCIIAGLTVLGSARAQTTVEYVHTDALGSVRAISDEQGNIIERYEYEPYGALIGKTNPDAPGYTGHVMDAATGLTYMQQRYMDPQLAVFLSVDPITAYGGDVRHFNRYAYAYNNPYRFTDPDGRVAVQIIGGVAGGLIGAGVSIYNGNTFGTVMKDMGIGAAVGALSTIPGGGAVATGLRAGLASGAGDAVSQSIDKGMANIDPAQTARAAVAGAIVGGAAKGVADKLVPNKSVPGLSESHPLVREGRAVAQAGSEGADAAKRSVVEASAAGAKGATVAAGQEAIKAHSQPEKKLR